VSSGGRKRCQLPLGYFIVSLKTTINTRIKNSKNYKKKKIGKVEREASDSLCSAEHYITLLLLFSIGYYGVG